MTSARRFLTGGARGAFLTVLLWGCSGNQPPQATPEPASTSSLPAASTSGTPASPEAAEALEAAEAPHIAERVTFEQGAMGTKVVISAFTTAKQDSAALKRAIAAAFTEIPRIEKLMSPWLADSELSRINREAGGNPVAVSGDTLLVLEKSLEISGRSEGVFDVSFEAMHGLWKFDENVDQSIPTAAAIYKAKKLIDYRQIRLDRPSSSVLLQKAGMRINLGGIAKGYAVDLVVKKLDDMQVKSFYVQAGGDLFVRGRKPDGTPYRVGIRDPRGTGPNDYFAMLAVEDRAFSTAGDYERSFVKEGKRYHHIIDPRTGYPATASRSVTVWAKSALAADALDDAVFILGAEKGLKLLESEDQAGAVVVTETNEVVISPSLADALQVQRPPTDGI